MFRERLNTPLKYATILGLLLSVALGSAEAVQFYSDSFIVFKGLPGATMLVDEGDDQALFWVKSGSLDNYMDEQGVFFVEITVAMTEELVTRSDGSTYYRLDFVFGPSGAYFEPEAAILHLTGKYVSADTEVWLYDENGEALPGTRFYGADIIWFEIPHFSEYSYDGYY